jgi:Flp pilus assembly protein TadG
MKMFLGNLKSRGSSKNRSYVRKSLLRRSGAAVLELALTLSILFSICYGLIEYGYYFYVKNTMEGAAREGCRAGIVAGASISSGSGSCNSVIANQLQVANLLPSGYATSGSGSSYTIGSYTVTYTDTGPTNGSTGSPAAVSNLSNMPIGDALNVTITANWGTVGQAFRPAALIGSGKVITTASAMRKEGQ